MSLNVQENMNARPQVNLALMKISTADQSGMLRIQIAMNTKPGLKTIDPKETDGGQRSGTVSAFQAQGWSHWGLNE